MKDKFNQLIEKAKANKAVLIRVGVAVGVAALSAGAVALAIHLKNERDQQEYLENEEAILLEEDNDEETEE